MQCSPPIPISRGVVVPSPSCLLIASANGNVLEIRDITTLSLLHSITTSGTHITHIAWSPFSDILAAASTPSNSVVLVNPHTAAVLADVHDSPLPIAAISLSATGVLLVSAVHSLSLTLFSVHRAKLLSVIPFATYRSSAPPIFAWSPCARFLAVATRQNSVPAILILSLSNGNITTALRTPEQLAGITDIAGLRWLQSGNILIWGAPLDPLSCSSVAVLKPSGKVLSNHPLDLTEQTPSETVEIANKNQRRLSIDTQYGKVGLGIKTLAVNQTGSLLAIGGYDGQLRIVNVAKWRLIKLFGHDAPEISPKNPPVIFKERTEEEPDAGTAVENNPARGNTRKKSRSVANKRKPTPRRSYFQILDADGGVEITKRVRSTTAPGSTSFGVSFAEFSPDGHYLASRSDKASNVVFIWDILHLRLSAVMILEHDARSIRWSKPLGEGATGDEGPQLGISCGEEFVYIWRRNGAAAVDVRGNANLRTTFRARKIVWSHDNSALLVADSLSANAFMSVYIS